MNSNRIASLITGAGAALGGLPLVQLLLTIGSDLPPNSFERVAIRCVGMICVTVIACVLITTIGRQHPDGSDGPQQPTSVPAPEVKP